MKLLDTRIQQAGVMRCCLASLASEYEPNGEVKIGDKSRCKHCKEPFTLVDLQPHPYWIPDWQIEVRKGG